MSAIVYGPPTPEQGMAAVGELIAFLVDRCRDFRVESDVTEGGVKNVRVAVTETVTHEDVRHFLAWANRGIYRSVSFVAADGVSARLSSHWKIEEDDA